MGFLNKTITRPSQSSPSTTTACEQETGLQGELAAQTSATASSAPPASAPDSQAPQQDAPAARPVLTGKGVALWEHTSSDKWDVSGDLDGERVVGKIGTKNESGKPFMTLYRRAPSGSIEAVCFGNAVNTLGGEPVKPGVSRYLLLNPVAQDDSAEPRRAYITEAMPAELFAKLGFSGEMEAHRPRPKASRPAASGPSM